jgi:periplasmic protein TonB
MNDFNIEKLDKHVDALLAGRVPARDADTARLGELEDVAKELSLLPRPEFRAALWANLVSSSEQRAFSAAGPARPLGASSGQREMLIPPLFSSSSLTFPMRGSHLAVSFGLHVAALALITASGMWVVENRAVVRSTVAQLIPVDNDYVMPVAPGKPAGGGGGGGDRDKMDASHGTAPRFAAEQLTPPLAVVRNEHPALPAEPTLIGPLDIVLPQSDRMGDPMANILNPPSNGTGSGGGIGSGEGGGIGSGKGPGIGEGYGGGIGGGIYRVGGGVSAPRPIYDPDPEYSEEARKAKFQGTVLLSAVIGPDGKPKDLRIMRSVGMGLDQKALDAVWKWRFAPGMRNEKPVSVLVSIEVSFRLY